MSYVSDEIHRLTLLSSSPSLNCRCLHRTRNLVTSLERYRSIRRAVTSVPTIHLSEMPLYERDTGLRSV